jgi:hypothetical protein
MHTSPESGSATFPSPGRYEPQRSSERASECVYQFVTIAAMVLVLASLWVF